MSSYNLTDEGLRDALDGLFAYDSGCASSGIHDELLRDAVKKELLSWTNPTLNLFLGRYMRDAFLSEEAMSKGYGPEDAHSFYRWASETMGLLP